ncbi:molybdate ABC transporter substrate-binding protein [Actinoalloteichus sp. AHMU CJ021]|uniref:molybdate ABC transporter substrate-binding protein n=1 Tax=Actinoalloteichus sp. AHMU CJ021 TaxID=2072503 RepID=UPI000CA02BB9|nr:molybdate ABC transporter substrate-binding protein [Actinoalloteichus sp. AHMU CJ021]
MRRRAGGTGRAWRTPVAVALVSGLAVAACSAPDQDVAQVGETSRSAVVFAAASLTEVLTELGAEFERGHPGTSIDFNFAASSALAQQIAAGAPADVFASASPEPMDQVVDLDLVAEPPVIFAANRLQIVVPSGNPGGVIGLADFADPDKVIALCAPAVPCGGAAREVLELAGIDAKPDTYERDVRATLTKVRLGEVDAALVYRTDVLVAGDEVRGVDFPESERVVNDYPLAALAEASDADLASAFVDYLRSPAAEDVLRTAGFDVP